jgi:sphingolipid delta-4 desaturase
LPADYTHVTYRDPHAARSRQILAAHPELRDLAGPYPPSAIWVVLLVLAQGAVALWAGHQRWYIWIPCAYVIGATIDHGLWALIHDCCHNLVFRSRTGNRLIAIVANLPLVFPGAISFAKYHLLHHNNLGDLEYDAGVPGPTESRVVGRSGWAKAAWLAGTMVVQGVVRPRRMKRIRLLDEWTIVNILFQAGCMAALIWSTGFGPITYLLTSSVFAIGLHPLGGRWIQEHFALAKDQETYSYYGAMNRLSFNVGYHHEHHDLISIPWVRLPEIRRVAHEFYDDLHSYRSWTALAVRFIRDPNITLYRYIVRPSRHSDGAGGQ